MKNKHRIVTFIVAFAICLIVIYLNLLSHNETQKIYLKQTEQVIINLRKDFLKDTINNVFLEIDKLRETKYHNYNKNTESRLRGFKEQLDLTDEEFVNNFIEKFQEGLNPKMWTAFLWNNKTQEIIFNTPDIKPETIEDTKENLNEYLSSNVTIRKNDIEAIFGVSKTYIDELVKEEMASILKNREFSSDSYIWVNEIINYEGGKDYAIRKVHPNLIDTEGNYLSTDSEDLKGNLPYLEELEGINKDGEIFTTYYFKKLNTSQISEKIAYARLYKDYDWVIAMGVHLDDIDAYAEEMNKEISSLSTESIIRVLSYILIVLLIGFIILYLIDKNHLSTSTMSLEKQVNLDTLTKAYSRRYGKKSLISLFREYKLSNNEVAIMMFDIDDFKAINDKVWTQYR